MLAAEAQRIAVRFAVVEQVTLVSLQHGPRDLQRLGDAALLQPCEEEAYMPLTAPHGELGVVLHFESMEMVAHECLERRLRRDGGFAFLLYAGHVVTPA
jgi:hypothetical protein